MSDMEKCMNVGGELDDYRSKTKKTEAALMLNKLGKNAKRKLRKRGGASEVDVLAVSGGSEATAAGKLAY